MAKFLRRVAVLVCLLVEAAETFIPKLCAENATRATGTCCPTPPGKVHPCGGAGVGRCVRLALATENFSPNIGEYSNDDRIDWPRSYFRMACSCSPRFTGFMCHQCQFGLTGDRCRIRHKPRLRRNVLDLSAEERKRFVELVDRSKYAASDWVVPDDPANHDPVRHPHFIEATVYDYVVYMHHYAGRYTVNKWPLKNCEDSSSAKIRYYDVAHNGPAFPTWHRLLMLTWERELQILAEDPDWSLPYWNWIGRKACDVCTNDLVGRTNKSSANGVLDLESPFSKWLTLCQDESQLENCRYCDTQVERSPLTRLDGKGPVAMPALPELNEVLFAFGMATYDTADYNMNATDSFRGALEGFYSVLGSYADTATLSMHNEVHAFFAGSFFYPTTSPNDPLFLLHHSFVDKLFETWLKAWKPKLSQFPAEGAPLGHNRHSVLAPFFPRRRNAEFFVDSRTLGYEYAADGDLESSIRATVLRKMEAAKTQDKPSFMPAVVIGLMVLTALVIAMLLLWCRRRQAATATARSRRPLYTDDGHPLLNE